MAKAPLCGAFGKTAKNGSGGTIWVGAVGRTTGT